jgi:hypothetical protein
VQCVKGGCGPAMSRAVLRCAAGVCRAAVQPEFATVGDDRVVRVCSLATKRQLASTELPCRGLCVAYSGDGALLAVGMERYDVDEKEEDDEVRPQSSGPTPPHPPRLAQAFTHLCRVEILTLTAPLSLRCTPAPHVTSPRGTRAHGTSHPQRCPNRTATPRPGELPPESCHAAPAAFDPSPHPSPPPPHASSNAVPPGAVPSSTSPSHPVSWAAGLWFWTRAPCGWCASTRTRQAA